MAGGKWRGSNRLLPPRAGGTRWQGERCGRIEVEGAWEPENGSERIRVASKAVLSFAALLFPLDSWVFFDEAQVTVA